MKVELHSRECSYLASIYHMKNKSINVFIVDDSQVSRELLAHIIESDPQLNVMGTAKCGLEAIRFLETHTPDVITMDVKMPTLDGFEVTQRIMESKPIPIVIVTGAFNSIDTQLAFRAIEAGALAILEKPIGIKDNTYALKAQSIINTVKMIAAVKVVKKKKRAQSSEEFISLPIKDQIQEIHAVGIGASLGGPLALVEILSHLSSQFPVPIFIVQHIAAGFINDLIKWLQERCVLPISLARQGERALPGHIYLAPDGAHMEVGKNNMIFLHQMTDKAIQPSIGHLFRSMAYAYGPHCIGVLLTGMGRDGAQDLLLMKQQGAYTIAQDEKSCVVFGMPQEAIKLGAASQVLPLDKIAPALIFLTKK